MSSIEKLLEKARKSPQNVSFGEVQTLASAFGLPLTQSRGGGSHYVQRLPDGRRKIIPRRGDRIRKCYVRFVVEAIDEFGKREGQDGGRQY